MLNKHMASAALLCILYLILAGCATQQKLEGVGVGARGSIGRGSIGNDSYENKFVLGALTSFDDAPKAVKPINNTTTSSQLPKGYDFSIEHKRLSNPSFLKAGTAKILQVIAKNQGNAPITVTFNLNYTLADNFVPDKALPLTTVIPPFSDLVILNLEPRDKASGVGYSGIYQWEIGDYKSKPNPSSTYSIPFSDTTKVSARASWHSGDDSTHNKVIFLTPSGAQVLASRNGVIVRVKGIDIDVLHDDSTIATYRNFKQIRNEIQPGVQIRVGDILGIAGESSQPDSSQFELGVWRPEPTFIASDTSKPSFYRKFFPIEFCWPNKTCRTISNEKLTDLFTHTTNSQAQDDKKSTPLFTDDEFSVRIEYENPSFDSNSLGKTIKIIARNGKYTPVSVLLNPSIDITDHFSSQKPFSIPSVVPANTEVVIERLSPKYKTVSYDLKWGYSWQIGNYTAKHVSPEHYRLPFKDGTSAFASAQEGNQSKNPAIRYALVFSLPPKASVLSSRKGTVARITENNSIDIVHDDATIATYSRLSSIESKLSVGKPVTAGEILGIAGSSERPSESFFQMSVWQPIPDFSNKNRPAFSKISLPITFCTGAKKCEVLSRSQPISVKTRNKATSK